MEKPRRLEIRKGDDMHLHLRNGTMLINVLPYTMQQFCRAVIMPNTRPQTIRNADDASAYRLEIKKAADDIAERLNSDFTPLMTIEITQATTPLMISQAKSKKVLAGKIYPRGQTTNSEEGVSQEGYYRLWPVFGAMEESEMPVLFHGELPNYSVPGRDREKAFLKILEGVAKAFPKLKIVFEHITNKESVELVKSLPNVAATITVHHLYITQDDVIGYSEKSDGKMQPHLMCKPIAKDEPDRQALREVVLSGHPRFFYGGDSAPHDRTTGKECAKVCAGVFNAPVALPALAELFDSYSALGKMENFVSRFGAEWYGLKPNNEFIKLVEEEWEVPAECGGVVPFMAGRKMKWQVVLPTGD